MMIDGLFFCDIIVNFMSAFDHADGSVETNLKVIALNYIKSWFFLDIIATFPTDAL